MILDAFVVKRQILKTPARDNPKQLKLFNLFDIRESFQADKPIEVIQLQPLINSQQ